MTKSESDLEKKKHAVNFLYDAPPGMKKGESVFWLCNIFLLFSPIFFFFLIFFTSQMKTRKNLKSTKTANCAWMKNSPFCAVHRVQSKFPAEAERESEIREKTPQPAFFFFQFFFSPLLFPPSPSFFRHAKDKAIRDRPFGMEVRNVQCLRCGQWGHQHVDRQCPKYAALDMPDGMEARECKILILCV